MSARCYVISVEQTQKLAQIRKAGATADDFTASQT
jgi:hypothetical protein